MDQDLSLRFPIITYATQIAEMYERQSLAQSKTGKKRRGGEADDDGFW